MDISLVMVVRNEEQSLPESLPAALKVCSEVIIVDTGSWDGTVDLLRDGFNIKPYRLQQPQDDAYNIVPARNYALSLATQPWILTLDADEVLSDKAVRLLQTLPNDCEQPKESMGFFGSWINERNAKMFQDYKLFLFRNHCDIHFWGRVHAVPQTAMRALALNASWLSGLEATHKKRPRRAYRNAYRQQMLRGIAESPHWLRYHWFLGYSLYQEGKRKGHEKFLKAASESPAHFFPVEALNAGMVLSEIYAARQDVAAIRHVFDRMTAQLAMYSHDFELKVNRHALWLTMAKESLLQERFDEITAPQFAY